MKAGAGGFAAGPEAVDRRAAVEVHLDAAHVIMRGRADRDRFCDRIDSRRAAERRDAPENAPRNRESRARRASRKMRCPSAMCRQTARATTSRGASSARGVSAMKRVPFSSTRIAPSPRTASLMRFKRRSRRIERGRVELDEFEIGECGSGAGGERKALAEGAGGICPMREEAADTARGDDDAARRATAAGHSAPEARSPVTAPSSTSRRRAASAFDHLDRGRRADRPRQGANDLAPGRVAAGMDDSLAPMRGLEPKQQGAVGAAVELNSETLEIFDRRGRRAENAARQQSRRKAHRPPPAYRQRGLPASSSGPILAAIPPCARMLDVSAPSGALLSSTQGSGARRSAVISPATPPPTISGRASRS